jgi:hypothetical protein
VGISESIMGALYMHKNFGMADFWKILLLNKTAPFKGEKDFLTWHPPKLKKVCMFHF